MSTFLKRPIEVEAVQFDGSNFHELQEFTGRHADPIDDSQINTFVAIGTYLVPFFSPEAKAELWVEANTQWLPIEVGEWVIKDSLGFYPCKDSKFQEIYDPACTCEAPTFEQELVSLINRHSMENFTGTPDFILANFLNGVLRQFDCAVRSRADWRGENIDLPALQRLREEMEKNDDV